MEKLDLPVIIEMLTHHLSEHEDRMRQDNGMDDLTVKETVYLQTIAEMESPTPKQLADRLKLSKPSITAIVDKLIKKQYIAKQVSEEDKRSFHILLTERGKEFTQCHEKVHQDIIDHFQRNLSPEELDMLVNLLNKVITTF